MPEPEKKETTPAVEELQKSLQELKSQNDKYAQLMQGPEMQSVLTKMANGEEIVFAEKAPVEDKTTSMKDKLGVSSTPKDVNLDELSNTDLTKVLSETVEQHVNEVREESAKQHQLEWQVLKDELTKTQDALLTLNAQNQVKEVASQHKDFEKYRPDMQELSQKYPQMSMEDLYTHVKGAHLIKAPNRQEIETEKPESSSTFPEWQPSHLRSPETGEKEKSVGPSTTALRSGGRKDFLAKAQEAAGRFVNGSNAGGL